MTQEPKKFSGRKIAEGFLAGVLAGVIAGLLLAPKKGKAMREDLKKISQKIWEEAMKETGKVGKLTKAEYEKMIGKVSGLYRKVKKKREA